MENCFHSITRFIRAEDVVPVRVTHLPNREVPILGMSLNFEFQKFSGLLVSFKFALAYLQGKKNKKGKLELNLKIREIKIK